MAEHICDNCGAAVADEQFCPTCGAWVDPLTSEGTEEASEEFTLGAVPTDEPGPPVRFPRSELQCPSCGSANPASNRHCEECGARLSQGALPVAPRPAVQTTAGVRAALGISAVLVVVILAVVVANVFGGEADPTGSTVAAGASTTTPVRPEVVQLNVIAATCSVPGISDAFGCRNLIDNDKASEYQFKWTDLPVGTVPSITLTFGEAVEIRSILWSNLDDPTRFAQNWKVQRVSITQGSTALPTELDNGPGVQTLIYVSLPTNELTIEITEAYPSSDAEGNVFDELAIAEIEVFGTPATGAPAVPLGPTGTSIGLSSSTTGG